tara:strand:+ start:22437 stop:23507 length:1071 start_codon:yes stop_codon:yes gene_type:complete
MIKTLYTKYFVKRLHNLENAVYKNESFVTEYIKLFLKKKIEYEWEDTSCICKDLNKSFTNNDLRIGKFDRYGLDFETVMCQNCGHIRAKNYPKDKYLEDFYSAHYRRLMHKDIINKEDYTSIIFNSHREASLRQHNFIFENLDIKKNDKELFILDFGGGSGGSLANLANKGKLLLYDFDTQFYEIAKKHNIEIFRGSFSELKKNYPKPDLIILSHVVEHWPNFIEMMKNIKTFCSNETNIYIEVPSNTSLSVGRSDYNLFGNLQFAHYSYFFTNNLLNYLEFLGFEVISFNNQSQILIKISENKKDVKIKNYTEENIKTLFYAEIKFRFKFAIIKKILRNFLGKKRIKILQKILGR